MKERLRSLKDRSFEEKLVILAIVLVLLSLAGCTVSSILEVMALRPPKRFVREGKIFVGKPSELKPPIHPLDVLPERIEGFLTNGRQKTPGAEAYMAEALYQPDDKDTATMMPMNTYAGVTYHESNQAAEKAIAANTQERYPRDKESWKVGEGLNVISGLDSSGGSYFIGWTAGQYSIQLFTSFTLKVPPNSEELLVDYGKKVLAAVSASSRAVLPK
jgi:hypothetical protein